MKEMYIGMAVCMIVFLAIGAFFMRPYYIFALALLVGNLGGALRIYHIYDVLDQALDMGEAGAKKKVIVNSLLRMIYWWVPFFLESQHLQAWHLE